MTSDEYLEIREIPKHLADKIFKWGDGKFDYLSIGDKLGLISNGAIVFDDDSDTDNMQDYMMYNSKFKGHGF
jgi:hypothetical protein